MLVWEPLPRCLFPYALLFTITITPITNYYHFQRGFVFGPYEGVLIEDADQAAIDGYCWEIRSKGKTIFIDGSDPRYSNWMRFLISLFLLVPFSDTLIIATHTTSKMPSHFNIKDLSTTEL